jgi:hypothetical protein
MGMVPLEEGAEGADGLLGWMNVRSDKAQVCYEYKKQSAATATETLSGSRLRLIVLSPCIAYARCNCIGSIDIKNPVSPTHCSLLPHH